MLLFVVLASFAAAGCRRDAGERGPANRTAVRDSARVQSGGTAAAGATFSIALNETLSAGSRVGDAFSGFLKAPLAGEGGVVAAPAGAIVRGRITAVARPGIEASRGAITLAFESLSWGGRTTALQGTVLRAHPQLRNRSGVSAPAGDTASGAADSVTNQEFERAASARQGGETTIPLGTIERDLVLPAGSELAVRLEAPLSLRP
jgi:hypothetical protein